VQKIGTITPGGTTEVNTGFKLVDGMLIKDVFLNVITPETTGATKTVNVGLLSSQAGGNASGFLQGISVATPGIVRGVATIGSGITVYYWASTTRGAYLATFYAGNGTTSAGEYYEIPFIKSSVAATDLSFTRGSVFSECQADIYVEYLQLNS
jgi:hypothetical protein